MVKSLRASSISPNYSRRLLKAAKIKEQKTNCLRHELSLLTRGSFSHFIVPDQTKLFSSSSTRCNPSVSRISSLPLTPWHAGEINN